MTCFPIRHLLILAVIQRKTTFVVCQPHYALGLSLVGDWLVHSITTDVENVSTQFQICLEIVESHLSGKSSKRDVTVKYILLL